MRLRAAAIAPLFALCSSVMFLVSALGYHYEDQALFAIGLSCATLGAMISLYFANSSTDGNRVAMAMDNTEYYAIIDEHTRAAYPES